jgi:hypothetical protein
VSRRIKTAYYKPKAGEWVQPVRRNYRLACCDCGLVHLVDFRAKHKRIQFKVRRATRNTAAIRRTKHAFVPRKWLDMIGARLLKATGRKRVRVGDFVLRRVKK